MMAGRRGWLGGCLGLLAATLLVCVGTFAVETQTNAVRRLFDDAVLDNREHYLRCDELPAAAEVKRVVEEHQDAIRQIEQAGGGVEYGTCTSCGETFFGIPYRLQNR